MAFDECGAPVGGVVTCSGSSYPAPGISYTNSNGLTLILDNPDLVAQKSTGGAAAVYIGSSGTNTNDIIIDALNFQSVTATHALSGGIYAQNLGTAGNAIVRMGTGTVTSISSQGSLFANISNSAGTGDALITLDGGQVANTGTGYGATARNAGTGNAAITMTGGAVTSASATGGGLRALIANTASFGTASVIMSGGTVTANPGTGILSQSELGSAGITMTGGTVEVQSGTNPALSAVVNNAASTGTASIVMGGGTVTNSGSGDGLFVSNLGIGTYGISITGGTVTGGAGAGAAIRASAAAGGTITIGASAIVNAGASGVALNQTGGAATITTAGTVTGNINLNAASNVLNVTGGTIDGNISGGGNSALMFDLGAASFTYGSAFAISGMDSVAMNSGTASIDGTLSTNTLAVNGGSLHINGTATVAGGTTVAAGGRLGGNGTINAMVTNAGTIAPGNSIGTLTIAGNYTGSGGTLEIEAVLGGDASPSDRLVVTGDTAGATNVQVVNLGGSGGQTVEGIKIVEVGGASLGTFSLLGDFVFQGEQAVVGGAYAYRLYQGGVSTPGDGDWYLRSVLIDPVTAAATPLWQPGVPLYEAYAGVLQAFNQPGTLQQRLGNRAWADGARDGTGLWARIDASKGRFEPKSSTTGTTYDTSIWKLEAGIDALLLEQPGGRLMGGLSLQYGTISSDVTSLFGRGSIDTSGFGLGASLTWYGDSGFYVDGQTRVTWYDSDLKSSTAARKLADGNGGVGYGLSLEAGQRIALGGGFSLTPQAQLAYSAVSFDDFTDAFGTLVRLDDGDGLWGRLGLSADYNGSWQDAAGRLNRAHVYTIANLYYDFAAGTRVVVAGLPFSSKNEELWGGLGLGGSLNFAGDRYSLYGEALVRTGLDNFGDSHVLSGSVGFRAKW